ncbi:MAG: hypothetical protein AAGD12_05620 [Pseudomonadota bacterium]
MIRALRYSLLLLAFLSLGASLAWIERKEITQDVARTEALLAIRAGLICTVERVGMLPGGEAGTRLPKLCRALAGLERLAQTQVLRGIVYRRLSENRYRLCIALNQPVTQLPGLSIPLDRKGCVEEVIEPEAAEDANPRRWRRARKV